MNKKECLKMDDHSWSQEAVIFAESVEYAFVCQKCGKREKRKMVCIPVEYIPTEKKTIWKRILEIFG